MTGIHLICSAVPSPPVRQIGIQISTIPVVNVIRISDFPICVAYWTSIDPSVIVRITNAVVPYPIIVLVSITVLDVFGVLKSRLDHKQSSIFVKWLASLQSRHIRLGIFNKLVTFIRNYTPLSPCGITWWCWNIVLMELQHNNQTCIYQEKERGN